MIVPIVVGAAALYGYFRFQKSKQQKELDALVSPPAPPHPGFAPTVSPLQAQRLVGLVNPKTAAGTGSVLTGGLAKIFGAGLTTADIPSGRIPSSAYGTAGPGTAPPTTSQPGMTVSTAAALKFKI